MKIAVFGSAFNPPTRGHLDAIQSIFKQADDVSKVLLIPSFKHAFSKQMLSYDTRLQLLDAFVMDIADERVETLAIEHLLAEGDKPVYTYDVLEYLQSELYPDAQLQFVIGPDNRQSWHKFYKADEILTRWSLLHVPENTPIRSTAVRENIEHGRNISALVTPSVQSLIQANHLYA